MLMQFGSNQLDLSVPRVMGILNITPDSFYDGGQLLSTHGIDLDAILKRAEKMVGDGAAFIDIGGESTRPGAAPVSVAQELDRVIPAVEAVAKRLGVVISVDTSTPEVISEAVKVGAGLWNDVRALQKKHAIATVGKLDIPVCLMHMQGDPKTMQTSPSYSNVVDDVVAFLKVRAKACIDAGLSPEKIIVDPGFGFGKTDAHNMALLRKLSHINALGYPILVGLSRKSMLGRILNKETDERLAGSLAIAMAALQNGAKILRVHDVAETLDTIKIYQAVYHDISQ